MVAGFRDALLGEYTPRQVAGSFAIGAFVAVLPTAGLGLLLFVYLSRTVAWINSVALFANAVVFNPPVKWGVYVLSVAVGVVLLGPVEAGTVADVTAGEVSGAAGRELFLRLLVGNVVLAVLATPVAYAVVYRLALRYDASEVGEVVEEAAEELAETVLEE